MAKKRPFMTWGGFGAVNVGKSDRMMAFSIQALLIMLY